MRIIGGIYRSRAIKMPRGIKIRPTQDRVREAIFNILAGKVDGARTLDLYAGSGAFGIEAISRGAKRAVFVDISRGCTRVICHNLKNLGVSGQKGSVILLDAVKAIKMLASRNEKFELIFIDPQYYRKGLVKNCLINISKYDILTPAGLVIVEHHKDEKLEFEAEGLWLKKQKKYGDTVISIYKRGI